MKQQPLKYTPEIFEKKSIEEAKNIILTQEKGTTTAQRWELETPYITESILSKVSLTPQSLVLDFGCGIGRISKELIEKVGCKVVGVDISPSMRNYAKEYVNSPNFQAVSVAEFKQLLYNGVRFDLALAVWVLQHCVEPIVEISLLRSALKPKGSLYVLNNIQMAIPTNKGWVSQKIDIFRLLEEQFELQKKSKLPTDTGNEYISQHTYEAMYQKSNGKKIEKILQQYLDKIAQFKKEKKYQEVVQLYLYMLKIEPLNFHFWNNLGITFESLREYNKAIEAYKNAVRINPKFSKAINNIGVVLYKQKRYTQSADIFQIALNIDPNYIEVYSNMGAALNKAKRYEESIKALETAIQKMPNHSGAYTNLGNVYNKLHEYKKAAKLHEKSIELDPQGYNAYSNVGTSYKNQGFTTKAIESYKKAIALKPDFENAHFDLSTVYLSIGDFENGLKEYEWRFQKEEMKSHIIKHKHIFSKPMMKKGQDIESKTILVHSEQGFGDSIMYARFLPKLKELGCNIVVECRDELKTLFETIDCVDGVVGREEHKTPPFDFHIPMMSLAYLLDVKSFDDFPKTPYFKVPMDDKFQLENKKIKIGLCWSASATGESYDGKVFELNNFEPLIKNPKIQIYSLQVGYGREQIAQYGYEDEIIDRTDEFENFLDTASFAKKLDLVISSDTSVAHLCGAIGVKTYTLLQKYPDWRWLNKGDDSYLYPSMKLFRQKQNRDWKPVFQSLFAKMNKEYKLKLKV